MQVKDMTEEQLKTLIRSSINEILDDYFGDIDDGDQIKESFKESLLEIRRKRLTGRHTISASEVYTRYGIEH